MKSIHLLFINSLNILSHSNFYELNQNNNLKSRRHFFQLHFSPPLVETDNCHYIAHRSHFENTRLPIDNHLWAILRGKKTYRQQNPYMSYLRSPSHLRLVFNHLSRRVNTKNSRVSFFTLFLFN